MEIQELQQLFDPAETNTMPTMKASHIERATRQQSQLILGQVDRAMRRKTIKALGIGLFACLLAPIFYLDSEGDFLLDQFLSPAEMSTLCALMGLLILMVSFQNWRAHRQILHLQKSSPNLRNGLRKTIHLLKVSQNVKVNTDAIGVPIFISWVLVAIYYPSGWVFDWRLPLLLVMLVVLFRLSRKLASKVNQPYQSYIESLEAARNELDQ